LFKAPSINPFSPFLAIEAPCGLGKRGVMTHKGTKSTDSERRILEALGLVAQNLLEQLRYRRRYFGG
jgi:hypothetical protein